MSATATLRIHPLNHNFHPERYQANQYLMAANKVTQLKNAEQTAQLLATRNHLALFINCSAGREELLDALVSQQMLRGGQAIHVNLGPSSDMGHALRQDLLDEHRPRTRIDLWDTEAPESIRALPLNTMPCGRAHDTVMFAVNELATTSNPNLQSLSIAAVSALVHAADELKLGVTLSRLAQWLTSAHARWALRQQLPKGSRTSMRLDALDKQMAEHCAAAGQKSPDSWADVCGPLAAHLDRLGNIFDAHLADHREYRSLSAYVASGRSLHIALPLRGKASDSNWASRLLFNVLTTALPTPKRVQATAAPLLVLDDIAHIVGAEAMAGLVRAATAGGFKVVVVIEASMFDAAEDMATWVELLSGFDKLSLSLARSRKTAGSAGSASLRTAVAPLELDALYELPADPVVYQAIFAKKRWLRLLEG